MRYMNWDVLLFPEGSKVPIQEFKTGCYITPEPGLGLDNNAVNATPRYLPTVSTFIPNMPLGSPLKVSIHSWEPPVANADTHTLARQGDRICFEARVLIDGAFIACIFFDQQPPWPQIIDTCSYPGKEGTPAPLTFPTFHSEMLTQNYWNAGENVGRIKILISEGLVRYQGAPFEKTGNIVCFSFQHAPLRVLEDSSIAYPNPGMLYQLQNVLLGELPSRREQPDPDAHGHSPRQQGSLPATLQSRMAMPLLSYPDLPTSPMKGHGLQLGDFYWSSMARANDVMGDARWYTSRQRGAASSSGDQSMPDYSHSITPASSRTHSNHQDPTNAPGISDYGETANEDLQYSPNRPMSRGTIPPTNTRVSSTNNTPSHRIRPSAAAEARATSYSHAQARSVPVTTRDPPPKEVRDPSDVSMHSGPSEVQVEGNKENEPKIKKKPAKDVKGRKEGKAGDLSLTPQLQSKLSAEIFARQNKENFSGSAEKPTEMSEGKRKRSMNELSKASQAVSENVQTFSPSRKISRMERMEGFVDQDLDDLTSEGVVTRMPLANMSNTI